MTRVPRLERKQVTLFHEQAFETGDLCNTGQSTHIDPWLDNHPVHYWPSHWGAQLSPRPMLACNAINWEPTAIHKAPPISELYSELIPPEMTISPIFLSLTTTRVKITSLGVSIQPSNLIFYSYS